MAVLLNVTVMVPLGVTPELVRMPLLLFVKVESTKDAFLGGLSKITLASTCDGFE